MKEEEKEALEHVQELLASGKTERAFASLKEFKEHASEQFLERDAWRMHELFGACFHDLGDAEGAAQAYFQAAQCDRFLRSQRQHFSNYLFALHYLDGVADAALYQEHLNCGTLYQDTEPLPPVGKISHEKIRVGYLAVNFLEQSVARFTDAMLLHYDRERFEVFCYSMEQSMDARSQRIAEFVDGWHAFDGLNFEEVAGRIQEDGVDILVDLCGHASGGMTLSVLAYRPAQVQVCAVGWFDTVGCSKVDYLLSDAVLAPQGAKGRFVEQMLELPHAFCWQPTEEMKEFRRFPRLSGQSVYFGCFCNFMKITDCMLRAWKRIVDGVPKSRLVLQDTLCLPARIQAMEKRVEAAGLGAAVQVRMASKDYMNDLGLVDILLDTSPYPGGGVTAASLYAGTPVVTLCGSRYGSRFGASILQSADCGEIIANTIEEYIEKAVSLARDEERLQNMQKALRGKMEGSALMDVKGYMKALEESYRKLASGDVVLG